MMVFGNTDLASVIDRLVALAGQIYSQPDKTFEAGSISFRKEATGEASLASSETA